MRYTPEPSSGFPRIAAIAAALVAWGFTGLILLAALVWGALLRCDESCGGENWRHTKDAWQWHAVTALGVAAFACGSALVYFVWKGRRLRAAVAVGLGLAAALALATAMSPDWVFHLDRRSAADFAVIAVGIGAPLVSLAFTAPRAETSGP